MNDRLELHQHACTAAIGLALQLALALTACAPVLAEPNGSGAAKDSLVICGQADELSGADHLAALTRGLQLADEAIAADNHDARAHFAAFCNLGKKLQVDGLGFSSWTNYRRMRRELDATLTLAPDDADTLAAKGVLLLHLPRLLGGDAVEAERLMRRALEVEPDNELARRYLPEVLATRAASDAQLAAHAANR